MVLTETYEKVAGLVELSEEVNVDKPLICEARWVDRDDGTKIPCEYPAKFTAIGHDELETHGEHQLVICQWCVTLLLVHEAQCSDCSVPLLRNVRPL